MRWRQLDLRLLRPLLRNRNQRVLDVGCGEGTFLRLLRDMGFHHLTGVDPFTEAPTAAGTSPHIVRSELSELPGVFDLIFLHHSLEHLPDQLAALREVRERLQPGGLAVIRIPVVDSWAARQYGSNWVALDAPRHLYLHTRESLRIAASSAGLMVTGWAYDSTGFQFWGSEQYKLGHPLAPAGSIGIHPKSGLFTSAQLRAWERAAHRLNSWGLGDTVIAVMQHADETENLISGWGAALST
jgi:SAM-dependent methyltransferase